MKPELKAMVAQAAGGSPYYLEKVFLAALHWRGDELWCGPNFFGYVSQTMNRRQWIYAWHNGRHGVETKDEARAALEAAAREQIAKWFKEQS